MIHLYGENGSDLLYGNSGNDKIYGGSGNDTIASGTGSDTLYGDSGNDILLVESSSFVTMNGGSGADLFIFDVNNMSQNGGISSFSGSEGDAIIILGGDYWSLQLHSSGAQTMFSVTDYSGNNTALITVSGSFDYDDDLIFM